MSTIFLSASVPLPDRDPDQRFLATSDVIAIRDSIRALVRVVAQGGRIVFGGHPAITPLIRMMLSDIHGHAKEHFTLYQSRFFEAQFPPDNFAFSDVRLVDAVQKDRSSSLARLRATMIGENDFDAAVFIGGMDGVVEEYDLFRKIHPEAPVYPIASTGAAALEIYTREKMDRRDLLDDLLYLSLFRRLLT